MSKSVSVFCRVFTLTSVLIIALMLNNNVVHADEKGEDTWRFYWSANDNYRISVDKSVKYGDNPYSVKIENTDFNFSGIEKNFKLKPDTQYIVSVMVKYAGYEGEKDNEKWGKGAHFRVCYPNKSSEKHKQSENCYTDEWKKVSLAFTTDSTGDICLRLINGGNCKGIAWFCDFRLEEVAETTNQWNILVLIIKSIDADVNVNGENSHYTCSYSDEDIEFLKKNLPKQLKYQLPRVSDGLIGVNNLDIYESDIVIKDLNTNGSYPNYLDPYNETLSIEMDKYLNRKEYQQIIAIPPLTREVANWQGLGGFKYKTINFCQYIYYPGSNILLAGKEYEDYQVSGYIHEILHGVESDSKAIDSETPTFHENIGIYKDYYNSKTDGWFSYHHDYITRNLPDGRGINQSVLYRPSVYLLVSDNLTLSKDLAAIDDIPTHISDALTVGKIKSVTYKGKKAKPAVKVTGAEKETDYTVTYVDNDDIGKGKAIIKGKGRYTGTIEVPFDIVMKKTSLKVKGFKLKWSKVSGADGYEVYYSKDGVKFKKLVDVSKNQYSLTKLKNGSFTFKVRAYARTNCGLIYGDWTEKLAVVMK